MPFVNHGRKIVPYNPAQMKLRDFEQHLKRHGCYVRREGGGHTIYTNPANGRSAAVPRHKEIKTATLRRICEVLGIPAPLTR